jgi:hypothetical protein
MSEVHGWDTAASRRLVDGMEALGRPSTQIVFLVTRRFWTRIVEAMKKLESLRQSSISNGTGSVTVPPRTGEEAARSNETGIGL